MMEIGLDIGTGFLKASGNGRKVKFPSLYSCRYSDRKNVEDISGKETLEEAVGMEAYHMGKSKKAILIRPVKYGEPDNDKAFVELARKAIISLDATPEEADIVIGVTWDAKGARKKIERLITGKLIPKSCLVLPQAYGTLIYCGKKTGTVVNMGQGTTEIISITEGGPEGRSIDRASEFITNQLDSRRGTYIHHEKLFSENPAKTAKLVKMLAAHIADELSRMIRPGTEIIIAGGGSLIPGMIESLKSSLPNNDIIPAKDPVFSNVLGLEMIAKERAGIPIPAKSDHTIDQAKPSQDMPNTEQKHIQTTPSNTSTKSDGVTNV